MSTPLPPAQPINSVVAPVSTVPLATTKKLYVVVFEDTGGSENVFCDKAKDFFEWAEETLSGLVINDEGEESGVRVLEVLEVTDMNGVVELEKSATSLHVPVPILERDPETGEYYVKSPVNLTQNDA